jgi:hypothetical protein
MELRQIIQDQRESKAPLPVFTSVICLLSSHLLPFNPSTLLHSTPSSLTRSSNIKETTRSMLFE